MCGIAGALTFDQTGWRVEPAYLDAMRDRMAHRGPDAAGTWISPDGRVGLGHRRLSIIDLSEAARQPMSNEDGSLRIVYNGEIYNHAEIRRELEAGGRHRWKTGHSDTEVILHAWEEWGPDCLSRFCGMFAFGLWDDRRRELWLVRDRIGIKPLYWSAHHGRLTFASEIKALLADPDQRRSVNEESFFHYLSFLTCPAPNTMFEGVCKLPPGTWLRVSEDGTTEARRYWDLLDRAVPSGGKTDDDIAEELLERLRESVRRRKMSDVPVGVFLSGGVDSSANAALFSEGEEKKISTFSIGYEGEHPSCRNELHYARRVAGLVGSDHHEKLLTVDDLMDFLPHMVWLQDEPIGDPVCVPVYYVSKLARDNGVKVCQVGEGADELFCGYPYWKILLDLQKWSGVPFPSAGKRALAAALAAAGKGDSRPRELLDRAAEGRPLFWGGAEAFTAAHKRRLLSPRLKKKFAGFSSWEAIEPFWGRFNEKAREKSTLNWMTYLDLNFRLPELLLMRVDKMSMGVGLEGRVPFLDHRFAEWALNIPTAVKTRDGDLKYILKKAVRGLIPDDIIDRKKQGFAVPVREWLFERLGDGAKRELEEFCRSADFLDRGAVLELLEKGRTTAWPLLNFALWWKRYLS